MTGPPTVMVGDGRTIGRWRLPDGGEVGYVAFGAEDAPTVVVLPGLNDGLAPLTDAKVARGLPAPPRRFRHLRVVVLSHRDPLPAGADTAALAADAARAISALCRPPVVVSGHSMGGMVAQHLAAGWPELVRALVLSATAAAADDVLVAGLVRWEELLRAGRWREFTRDAVRTSYTGAERTRRWLALEAFGIPRLADRVERHLALSRACRTHDATGFVARITQPALVVAGARDPLVRPEASWALAEALPAGRFVLLGGVAHGFPEQARHRYTRLVARFLTEVLGGR